ncbi:MAG: hypothetical protein IT305_30725 [Chloroflexi bacterium]|nr:hypothetical protein [Chloroflexota bacterium]
MRRELIASLVVNAALPFALYKVLSSRGVADVPALTATAIFPFGWTLYGWWRSRRLDLIASISLVTIVVGIVTSLISNDPVFFMVKESLLTAVWSLLCFGSLLFPRPLMFYFGRAFVSAGHPERAVWFDRLWQYEEFRFSQRLITAVWGVGYAVEAGVRVVLALTLPISTFLLLSAPLMLIVTAGLIVWTMAYSKRVGRRARAAHRTAVEHTSSTEPAGNASSADPAESASLADPAERGRGPRSSP